MNAIITTSPTAVAETLLNNVEGLNITADQLARVILSAAQRDWADIAAEEIVPAWNAFNRMHIAQQLRMAAAVAEEQAADQAEEAKATQEPSLAASVEAETLHMGCEFVAKGLVSVGLIDASEAAHLAANLEIDLPIGISYRAAAIRTASRVISRRVGYGPGNDTTTPQVESALAESIEVSLVNWL